MDSAVNVKKEAKDISKLEEESVGRLWSKLPTDVLINVLNTTSLVDQRRLAAVCKDWKLVIRDYASSFPWLMLYHWRTCKLYDPYRQQVCTLQNGFKGEDVYSLIGAEACASKHGWVLFCEKRVHEDDKSSTFFFIYSPFVNEVVRLPELKNGFDKATFSSTPTSSDCLFFAVRIKVIDSGGCIIRISMCHSADQAWETFSFCSDYLGGLKDIIYLDRVLYCLFCCGNLGAFDVSLQKWCLLCGRPVLSDSHCLWGAYLIESDGQLLSLVKKFAPFTMCLSQFDFLRNRWVEGISSGNRVLFLGSGSFSVSAAGEFADTVSFFEGKCYKRYSFRTGKLIEPEDTYYHTRGHNESKIWIMPPQLNA